MRLALHSVGRVAVLAAAVLGTAACGDSSTPAVDAGGDTGMGSMADAGRDDGGGGPQPDSGLTVDAFSPTGDAGQATIAGIASASADFEMLVAAASRAGLVTALDSPGALTVFAPTDDAFMASGITMAMINSMPVADLTRILQYHVLPAEVPSSAVTAGVQNTLADLSLVIGTTGGVTLNGGNAVSGGATVVMADVEASNGVIHVIDRVLLPPTVADLARYAGLTQLVNALGAAPGDLDMVLAGAGPFTVFAPTDAAFAALPAVPTGDALATVLLYHVVSGAAVESDAVPASAASAATNQYGDNLTLLFDTSTGVVINGGPEVVIADVRGTNGVVHVIDAVILPMDIVDAATAAGLTGILGVITTRAPSIATALEMQAPYTLFAPNNAAVTAAGATVAGLSDMQVANVLLYHVLDTTTFPSPVLAADLPTSATELDTLFTDTITFAPGPPPTVDGAGIVATDIVVTNGVIHLIDEVMVPSGL